MTPSFSSDRSALPDSAGENVVRTRSAASISRIRAERGSIARKSPSKCVARELGDLAGDLDAGRAGADDGEGQPLGAGVGVGLGLGGLERAQDWLRTTSALSSDFTSAANSLQSSCPKYE